MNPISVRPAVPADFDAWLPLWRGYQAFYKVDIADGVTRETWRRFHDAGEPMHCTLAELDGRAVGMVHFIEHRSCWTSGNYFYLQDLFTDAEVRGRGVGRALIEHVYEQAQARGCTRVHWLTHHSNATATQLYDRIAERSGFVQYRKVIDLSAPRSQNPASNG
jgi:GNAT superfamily N-acetyltransferase